jgi:glutathione S-transferase
MNNNVNNSGFELIVAPPSTWALRAWLVLKLTGTNFKTAPVSHETLLDKVSMAAYSDTGLVPVLNHGGHKIHDSLAIAEYLHELFPDAELYPKDQHLRAHARSLVAELHSGFTAIRTQLPFFIGEPKQGETNEAVQRELKRLANCWAGAALPYYFDKPGIVDAFYGVMAARLYRYQIKLGGPAGAYRQSLLDWDLLQKGLEDQTRW